jgi:hypothetical protein
MVCSEPCEGAGFVLIPTRNTILCPSGVSALRSAIPSLDCNRTRPPRQSHEAAVTDDIGSKDVRKPAFDKFSAQTPLSPEGNPLE